MSCLDTGVQSASKDVVSLFGVIAPRDSECLPCLGVCAKVQPYVDAKISRRFRTRALSTQSVRGSLASPWSQRAISASDRCMFVRQRFQTLSPVRHRLHNILLVTQRPRLGDGSRSERALTTRMPKLLGVRQGRQASLKRRSFDCCSTQNTMQPT